MQGAMRLTVLVTGLAGAGPAFLSRNADDVRSAEEAEHHAQAKMREAQVKVASTMSSAMGSLLKDMLGAVEKDVKAAEEGQAVEEDDEKIEQEGDMIAGLSGALKAEASL
eukprot:CAMPEP_0204269792 /NCGR_PEP_ID=MMETSP0468-20130131/17227_1 /ASSEMBLY_ACC=CAM_ASM_000383 /TAXON_ID=2969 /ORGANISM="Oxyrrhis marina" /LENGTH=109 /DNA_ID=CAMNT_0051245231 /DNA_START=28 /DNA_END=357 /DNA_ORIENTATION=+